MTSGRALRVVLVDDDEDFLALLSTIVREAGGAPLPFTALEPAVEAIARGDADAVLTDYRISSLGGGDEVVRACRDSRRVPVAVVSAVDSAEVALALVRLGADDYFLKPSAPEELVVRVRTFLERAQLELDSLAIGAESGGRTAASELLRASPALRPLLRELPRAARSGASVLVGGETGTGKELAARAVHELSRRSAGPFVAVDCAAIPENLLENELFGHRKGAFTDAREDADGLVALANGGTLFLDEVGELSAPMQAKLLRFLQTREYRRLGDSKTLRADVRLISATHRDLLAAAGAGKFREDLYYRINVVALTLPPLRERIADIPLLAIGFMRKYAVEFDSPALNISQEALDELCRRTWPGNVRQLENAIQNAVAMATGPILDRAAFGARASEPAPSLPTPQLEHLEHKELPAFHVAKQELIDSFEQRYAQQLVRRHAGNLSAAAREAGLDRKSLVRLLARHGLQVEQLVDG